MERATEIKLALDLITHRTGFVVQILKVEKESEQNYVAVSAFGCDICQRESSTQNPIWTHAETQGVDICNLCIEEGFTHGWEPMPGWNPGPVYSLKELLTLLQ